MLADTRNDTPASLGRTASVALGLALVMCWPLWVTGQVFVFFDTEGYLRNGDKIFELLQRALAQAVGSGAPAGGAGDFDPQEGQFLRSFGYAAFASGAATLGGALLLGIAQGWIAIFAALSLAPRHVMVPAALLLAVPLSVTTLPWFAIFAMPDIFTAVVILFGALLWRRFDRLTQTHRAVLVVLAALACLMHYGNPPLAFGLYALVLAARAMQRRLPPGVVLAAALPVLMGPVANLGASAVVLDQASTAPKRLPILLARSIEDGPATWYLRETCASPNDLAICAAFDGSVPDDITEFLWSEGGIRSLEIKEIEAIREQEARVLVAAFMAYPVAQTRSLTQNAWKQFYSVGLAKIEAAADLRAPDTAPPDSAGPALVAFFDPVVDWTSMLGGLALIVLAARDRQRLGPVLIVFAGLALNAGIFGGLSAPDDRYQARVIWILPFLALVYLPWGIFVKRRGTDQTMI